MYDTLTIPISKRYRYTGKERDSESGLYFYGARYYVPWLCRFLSVDPKAAQFPNQSAYNYCFNNPINLIDPDGMAPGEPGGPDDPPKGSESNPVILPEVEIVAPKSESKETTTQKVYRTSLTAIAQGLNELSGGKLDDDVTDKAATAYHLFYEWVMGKGEPTRQFDETSEMGKQMLESPEISEAIDKVKFKSAYGDYSGEKFARILRDEDPVLYATGFPKEALDNSARAFHGSFGGDVSVQATPLEGGNDVLIQMTVRFTDKMTATSGSRAPEQAGGYDKNNPTAVYTKENPYGDNGQFRTITVSYEMKLNVIIHTQKPNWSKGVAPTFNVTPTYGR